MSPTTIHEKCAAVCNGLLRGELSAIETYDQVIDKFAGQSETSELVRIRDEHRGAVERLRANVVKMGGTPTDDSGAWGTFANAITSIANLLGDDSAISTLKQGEEHGQRDYEAALNDKDVLPECRQMIRDELLPKVCEHIAKLDTLAS